MLLILHHHIQEKSLPLCLPGTVWSTRDCCHSARNISATHRHRSHVYVMMTFQDMPLACALSHLLLVIALNVGGQLCPLWYVGPCLQWEVRSRRGQSWPLCWKSVAACQEGSAKRCRKEKQCGRFVCAIWAGTALRSPQSWPSCWWWHMVEKEKYMWL